MKLTPILLIFGLASAAAAQSDPSASLAPPAPAFRFQYAAKFVCGTSAVQGNTSTLIAPGRYFSQTNVHNPSRYQTVNFRKKFAIAEPFERAGRVSAFFNASLKADEALQVDCGDIFSHLALPTSSFVEGFVVIESPLQLDVDTVYTAGPATNFGVSSIHTERVGPRTLEACGPLNFNLSTGVAPWQVVAEQQSAGAIPRPATIYGSGPPVSNVIGALPTPRQWHRRPALVGLPALFCACSGAQNLRLNLTGAYVDDVADLKLNGHPIGQIVFNAPPPLGTINSNAAPFFQAGQNCLDVRLTDLFVNGQGFALAGSILGADAACPTSTTTDLPLDETTTPR